MAAQTRSILDYTKDHLERAQSELAEAEIALIEASAKAEVARDSAARLESAVAALSGDLPPSVAPHSAQVAYETAVAENRGVADLTPEEFDKQRKKRQRAREKELEAQNPLAHIKCSGCGRKGKMTDSIIQAPSGASVRMMICGSCGNQSMS